ncbi:cytochrome c-type biogenesis protein CcmH [Pseudomonadota bacterium]|nr:cytochrome c-type biogenesis protein CcmH [Pseudomonadota bacterium]
MKIIKILIPTLLLAAISISLASDKIYSFENSNQQLIFESLLEELRCLVCQNQSLADSGSGLATDLRDEVYQMVLEDNSHQTIKKFLVERYGNFVLYDPPLNPSTSILWFAPFLMAIIAVGLILFFSNRPKQN